MQKCVLLIVCLLMGIGSMQAAFLIPISTLEDLKNSIAREQCAYEDAYGQTRERLISMGRLSEQDAVSPEDQALWHDYSLLVLEGIARLSEYFPVLKMVDELYHEAIEKRSACEKALRAALLRLYAEKQREILARIRLN